MKSLVGMLLAIEEGVGKWVFIVLGPFRMALFPERWYAGRHPLSSLLWSYLRGDPCRSLERKHSVTGGNPTSVVSSEPLHGGSSNEWVTGPAEVRGLLPRCFVSIVRRTKVPPQGFSEDRTGPSACHFSTLE